MELLEVLEVFNPLYAFPIIAVIICVFVVYTFGFKSPLQPPSFETIEDENKFTKKRKTKDASKKDQGKVNQNGKLNANKSKSPRKKKEEKVTEKVHAEKPVIEKKVTKKKAPNENKPNPDKKKIITAEDASEDGWVQLVSKKSRKNRKDEPSSCENVVTSISTVKQSDIVKTDVKSDIDQFQEKKKKEISTSVETYDPPKNQFSANQVFQEIVSPIIDNTETQDKVLNGIKSDPEIIHELFDENSERSDKTSEKNSTNKSKKKKKNSEKNPVVKTKTEFSNSISDVPTRQVKSEISSDKTDVDSPVKLETHLVINDKIEENLTKESKSSNVVFDELEGLYPQVKEQKKKKKVRRDH